MENTTALTGEKNLNRYFKFLQKVLPMPKPVKAMIINLLTYILSM